MSGLQPKVTLLPTDLIFFKRQGSTALVYATMANFAQDVLNDIRLEPTVSIADQVGDDITVSIQLAYSSGDITIDDQKSFTAFLTSDDAGAVLAAAAPSGGWAKGSSGAIINLVANKYGLMQTDATGLVKIVITESTSKSFYLVMIMPDGLLYGPTEIAFTAAGSV